MSGSEKKVTWLSCIFNYIAFIVKDLQRNGYVKNGSKHTPRSHYVAVK